MCSWCRCELAPGEEPHTGCTKVERPRAVLLNLTEHGRRYRESADRDPVSGGSAIARIMAENEARLDAIAMALVRVLNRGSACERRLMDGKMRESLPCSSCLKTVRTFRRAFDRARRVGR